ncbi:hypothetical protein BRADI_1g07500v3 [Brachypodium distachyon]|uniref:Uncharacterized protein n=1 Tax=Brachypodium distachyon TaxID=15368 RepID=I1GMX5_BRADI|nr:hypothetical protein BRADI_1g07500v3 [Brachypodium distachyon]
MSSLIDIWTAELERIRATRRPEEPFRPVAWLGRAGAREGGHFARSDDHGSTAQPCDDRTPDDNMAWPAKKQTAGGAGSNCSPSPVVVREDAFLSILVDCLGQ